MFQRNTAQGWEIEKESFYVKYNSLLKLQNVFISKLQNVLISETVRDVFQTLIKRV